MACAAPFDDLKTYLDRWAAVCMSCEAAERPAAENGIRWAYAAAGLVPPERIVWCGGPMEIAKRLATASPDEPIGANVKAEVFDGSPTNFMVLTRATVFAGPGADGILGTADDTVEQQNTTSPFVDQNQTYTSRPSHQVFLPCAHGPEVGKSSAHGTVLSAKSEWLACRAALIS